MIQPPALTKKDVIVTILCVFILCTCLNAISIGGRRHAKAIVCQAHLAQWGRVFQNYVAENNGKFFSGTTPQGYWWPRQLDNDLKDWKRNKVWFCPEAETPVIDEYGNYGRVSPGFNVYNAWGIYAGDEQSFGKNGLAGSYGLNGYTLQISGPTFLFPGRGVSSQNGWKSFDVPEADRIPLFFDALRFDLWPVDTEGPAATEFAAWSSNNMASCAINRHMGSINSLFLDGSARRVDLKELWTLKWHKSFNTQGPWTLSGGVKSEDWPEWIRDFQDY